MDSILKEPSYMNMGIINSTGIILILLLTVLSAWLAARNKTGKNPVWSAILMIITSLGMISYNSFSIYQLYMQEENSSQNFVIMVMYLILALVFLMITFGIINTASQKKK